MDGNKEQPTSCGTITFPIIWFGCESMGFGSNKVKFINGLSKTS